jgi:4a-hydroxytetrahydrobiopterin dehydratase
MPADDSNKVYTAEQIAAQLSGNLPHWSYEDGHIARTFKTRNWVRMQMLFNAIGFLAEKADHHPDMIASYGSLNVRIMTHSAGGITDKDFDLAAKIDALAE